CVSLFGPPEPWQVACFAWLMTPLFSVALLSRTGRLPEAQTLAALCFIGLALTLGLRGGALSGAAFAWLLLAVVEAAFTLNRTLVGLIGGTAAAAGLFLVSASGGAASPSSGLGLMLADFPAIA